MTSRCATQASMGREACGTLERRLLTLRPVCCVADLLLLAARTEDEVSHLEVWVYEEAGEDGEANLYVHHDQLLPAFPLALAWLDCPPGAQGAVATGSLCAVGTMESAIEVWDLDLLDAVEPALTLGTNTPASQQTKPGRKAKPKASPAKGKAAGGGGGGGSGEGHSDAVLGLSWNATFRNVLASASADSLVKVWDVACGRCEHTLAHHGGKVQACAWSPASASLLLTGSFDRTAAVADVRTPGGGVLRFALSADCEALCWAPGASGGHLFAVTAEDGTLSGHDARAAQAPLFRVAAHGKAACGVAACPAAPGLLATCGMDKTTALWDVRTAEPALLQRKDLRVGAAFGVAFAQSAPHLLAAAGGRGTVTVWDCSQDDRVTAAFPQLLGR